MHNENPNRAVKCAVVSCTNHCCDCDYCSLSSIQVGTHEPHPSMDECTDCKSFCKKQ